ncbi:MAG: HD domain-containing protein [Bacteroidia bacterium]|nr:HD domain-containing protein [Bacteroidia bacterium]
MNKLKIINDPVYGFITLPNTLVFDLIEHPWFQRLRYIRQLGMTHLVYPGALHTRFHHALGAMHLMTKTLEELKAKGHSISDKECEGAIAAILLHDIGHGPFSHALENSLAENIHHEDLSLMLMEKLNTQLGGRLTTAIEIFTNRYPKKFLHQLVSSQLDMDRLDYLMRDSFFTGVSEGVISSDRIIKMLQVKNDQLVVEEKGIYSVEKFIIARRLMYWQVYLHKTVLSAENILINILLRAKELSTSGVELFASPALAFFLKNSPDKSEFLEEKTALEMFTQLDDSDIFSAIKNWQFAPDKALALLCKHLVQRNLFRVEISQEQFSEERLNTLRNRFMEQSGLDQTAAELFVFSRSIANNAYNPKNDKIYILQRDGVVKDVAEAADQLNISALSEPVVKYFICYPKSLS